MSAFNTLLTSRVRRGAQEGGNRTRSGKVTRQNPHAGSQESSRISSSLHDKDERPGKQV